MNRIDPATSPCSTGIAGLDHVLAGGFPRNRFYLVIGDPGVGKTTLSLQYLITGAAAGERVLYVTLSETKEEILAVAQSHGWSLDGIDIVELSSIESQLADDAQSTLFHPSEVELSETTRVILDEVERVKPRRIVLDSLSEMRLLAGSALRYRRQLLALKQYFVGKQSTVLLLDDRTAEGRDLDAQSIAHGVVLLQHLAPEYGGERRRLRVMKLRGVAFRGGYHDYAIRRGGLDVYPRLIAAEDRRDAHFAQLASGIPELDSLIGGGLDLGTSSLIIGPAGTGKSVIATVFAAAAAERGEKVEIFTFDETRALFLNRAKLVGRNLEQHLERGNVRVHQIDPAELSPGEFSHRIRERIRQGVHLVIIDSINGYHSSMPDERHLELHLHELCSYCSQFGAATLMLAEQKGIIGSMQMQVDVTYLADTVILLRHFEFNGEVRQAVSVLKKRSGAHERFIRELKVDEQGVRIGGPLHDFRGVLSGIPTYHGNSNHMMPSRHA
jgi:circadian clock protein KaiC